MHGRGRRRDPDRFAKEGSFPDVALDKVDVAAPLRENDRDDQAGKARTAPEVKPLPSIRKQRDQLGAVRDMSPPQVRERAPRDQVCPRLPFLKERDEGRETI